MPHQKEAEGEVQHDNIVTDLIEAVIFCTSLCLKEGNTRQKMFYGKRVTISTGSRASRW